MSLVLRVRDRSALVHEADLSVRLPSWGQVQKAGMGHVSQFPCHGRSRQVTSSSMLCLWLMVDVRARPASIRLSFTGDSVDDVGDSEAGGSATPAGGADVPGSSVYSGEMGARGGQGGRPRTSGGFGGSISRPERRQMGRDRVANAIVSNLSASLRGRPPLTLQAQGRFSPDTPFVDVPVPQAHTGGLLSPLISPAHFALLMNMTGKLAMRRQDLVALTKQPR
jgi:hypothetical protein